MSLRDPVKLGANISTPGFSFDVPSTPFVQFILLMVIIWVFTLTITGLFLMVYFSSFGKKRGSDYADVDLEAQVSQDRSVVVGDFLINQSRSRERAGASNAPEGSALKSLKVGGVIKLGGVLAPIPELEPV